MGTTLNGTQINNTYPGLLKLSDNAAIGATEKVVGDGLGGDSTLSLGTTSASFTGTLALGSATVTGLDGLAPSGGTSDQVLTKIDGTDYNYEWRDAGGGGAAGLVNAGFTDAMKNADTLVTTPATALGTGDIVLGNNARVTNTAATNLYYAGDSIVIGNGAEARKVVDYSFLDMQGAIAIGKNARAEMNGTTWPVAIGHTAIADDQGVVAIGHNSNQTGSKSVAIGQDARGVGAQAVSLGPSTDANGYASIAIGSVAQSTGGGFGEGSIVVGQYSNASASNSIVLGCQSTSGQAGGIVIGNDITADKADTLHTHALDLATASTPTAGGIVFTDAGSTERRLNITSGGTLQVDSTPVGVVAVSNLTETSHAGPDTADNVFVSITVPANTFKAGDVVLINTLTTQDFTGGGWIYNGLWISNSTTFGTGVNIASNESTSNQAYIYAKTGFIHTSDGTGSGTSFFGGTGQKVDQVDAGASGFADNDNVAIDWTSTVYINLSCFVDNASSSITNKGMNIVKIN